MTNANQVKEVFRSVSTTRERNSPSNLPQVSERRVEEFKRRILEWPNPVEYVNNMYGCHPGDRNSEYFEWVFGRPTRD